MYDIPEELLGVPVSACVEDMYYTEILLPAMVRDKKRFYREDPTYANLFWVPHRSTCQYHACLRANAYEGTGTGASDAVPRRCKAEVAQTLEGIWRHVVTRAPHWNASGGTDHVLVFAWDAASALVEDHPVAQRLQPAIHLTHYGTVRPAPASSRTSPPPPRRPRVA